MRKLLKKLRLYIFFYNFLGAQFGLVDIKEFLPSRQTLSRTVDDLAAQCRIDFKEELSEPLRAKAVTIAPDFWLSKYSKQSFLGINATYVNSIYQFKSVDLLCRPFYGIKSYDLILEVSQKYAFFLKRFFFNHTSLSNLFLNIKDRLYLSIGYYNIFIRFWCYQFEECQYNY